MAKVTKTVEIGGEEHEVEVEVDPTEHGYLPKERFQEEVERRVASAKENARKGRFTLDEIAEDEEIFQKFRDRNPELFESEDDDSDDDGKQGLTEEDLDRFREKWESKHVEPLKGELEDLQQEAKRLRVEKLDREVVEAASKLGVRPGLVPLIKRFYRDQMGYSDEDAEWYRRDGDGFDVSTDEDTDAPYVTVLEDMRERKSQDDFADWFESTTRGGAGYSDNGDSGVGTGWSPYHEMDDEEKRRFIEEEGPEAWQEYVEKGMSAT